MKTQQTAFSQQICWGRPRGINNYLQGKVLWVVTWRDTWRIYFSSLSVRMREDNSFCSKQCGEDK